MANATDELHREYVRQKEDGAAPDGAGLLGNRMALHWRPIIDLADGPFPPMRLSFVKPVADWLADPAQARWPQFAMIAVSGLRHQVVRHAGLPAYDCEDPADLAPELRTGRWQRLVEAIAAFHDLDFMRRTLTVFQLTQLSLCRFAITLAGRVEATGDVDNDTYAHMMGRVYARYPDGYKVAVPLFQRLAERATDPVLALQACFQGMGHTLRNPVDLQVAVDLEAKGRELVRDGVGDSWLASLAKSRFHRAVALLRLRQKDPEGMAGEIETTHAHSDAAIAAAADPIDAEVALENRRIIIESQIKAAARVPSYKAAVDVGALCEELADIDGYCLYTRRVLAEGYTALGDLATAATWYVRAGELGTAAGALSWFRAAECYERLGDGWSALNAMAHCLALDPDAVEARRYIARVAGEQAPADADAPVGVDA